MSASSSSKVKWINIIEQWKLSGEKSEEGVRTAELPESLLNRCQADESLLADILVKKFADHLPLYRQSEIMAREGIYISRQILSQWTLRAAMALKPLYNVMIDKKF